MNAQPSRRATELAGEATWLWDLASNCMTANAAYCDLLGLSQSAALRPFHIVPMIAEPDRDRVLASLFQTIAGEHGTPVTFGIVRPDGAERTVIGRAVMDEDSCGVRSIVRGSLTDVTGKEHLYAAAQTVNQTPHRAPVLVSGRDRFSRLGLVAILSESVHVDVIGDVPLDTHAIETAWGHGRGAHRAPLVVVDVDAPTPEYERLVQSLLASDPRTKVLAMVRYSALDVVAPLTRAGTARLLTPEATSEELQQAVWQLAFGIDPPGATAVFDSDSPLPGEHIPGYSASGQLTATEAQVLRLLAMGQRNREIGATLFMSEPTVKRHTQQIYRKLGARDRAHAAALANHLGLLRQY